MPEDTSDDSSITDCCRSKLVAIRNSVLLHTDYSRNMSVNNQTVVLPYVQVSRFAKFMRDKAAMLADDIACLLSDKETGIRDKFLLFFTSICNVPVRKSAKVFGPTARDLKKSKQNWSANKRFWQLGFMRGGVVKLHSADVREAYPALARLSGSMQPCLRTLQQKF